MDAAVDARYAVLRAAMAVGGILRIDFSGYAVGILSHERIGETENQSLSRRDAGVRRHRLRRRLDAAGYRLVRCFGVLAGRHAFVAEIQMEIERRLAGLYRRLAFGHARFGSHSCPCVRIPIMPCRCLP